MRRLIAALAVALAVALILPIYSSVEASACSGVSLRPGSDLSEAARANPPGTTFCIQDGNHRVPVNIPVEDGDTFWGLYTDGSRPQLKGVGADHILETQGADNATIRGLAVSGATGGDYCEPDCGRGIGGGGKNLLLEDVRAYNNANQGAGGLGEGAVIRDSRFDHNGTASFSDFAGPRSAAGLKTVSSIEVYDSEFTQNYWNGFWCDEECGATEVHDSVLSGNGKAGLDYEISSGPAVFEGNTIQENGFLASANRHVGLLIVESSNVEAYNNTLGGNAEYGALFAEGNRHPLENVTFRENETNGDILKGCSLSGVTCEKNR